MSFYEVYQKEKVKNLTTIIKNASNEDVLKVLEKENLTSEDFLILLSPAANKFLEHMAIKAQKLTQQNFGKSISLYTPIYVANYCVNNCIYCGFNIHNRFPRVKLSIHDVEKEAQAISSTGLKHILMLTGESRKHTPISYLKECVGVLKKYFSSISLEVFPLETNEYEELIEAGVDGLTVYQEVYDEDVYKTVHLSGPKSDYKYRLDAPERGCQALMRTVNIGALLGLTDFRLETFFTGLHANYLQKLYPLTEISTSVPRMRPHCGNYEPQCPVNDRDLVQIILAFRLFLPRCGITISTREDSQFRDNLIGLGITKMSAGSSTEVGGHSQKGLSQGQFDISDNRRVSEITDLIYAKGYQPVFKDWLHF